MVHGGKLCATASKCGQHNLIVTCGHVCSVATTSESNIDIDLHSDCTPCMGRGLCCILHYIIYIHIKFILNSKTHEGQNVKKRIQVFSKGLSSSSVMPRAVPKIKYDKTLSWMKSHDKHLHFHKTHSSLVNIRPGYFIKIWGLQSLGPPWIINELFLAYDFYFYFGGGHGMFFEFFSHFRLKKISWKKRNK